MGNILFDRTLIMNKEVITYSLSAGQHYDGKSVVLWRTVGTEAWKIARFQSKEAARLFAEDFNFPLSDELKTILEQTND